MLVTEPSFGVEYTAQLIAALGTELGARLVVQLRDREQQWRREQKLALGEQAKQLGAQLWVNRDLELANALRADGLHANLLQAEPFRTRSAAVHCEEEWQHALRHGANSLVVSPIYKVAGKGAPCGTELLRAVRRACPSCEVWALGGIGAHNGRACLDAGADGLAVRSSFYTSTDPVGLVRGLW